MIEKNRPAALNLINISKLEASPATSNADLSPSLASRRRRTKLEKASSKSSEQLIQQSHEMLMQYIEGLDGEVRGLLENHEAQFLIAYRKHSAKVKEEMTSIKKQMLENAQVEKHYLDRIRYLERELIVFREETFKMSEKLITKNDEIQRLKIKLKEALAENRHQHESIRELTKTGMGLSAQLKQHETANNDLFLTNLIQSERAIDKGEPFKQKSGSPLRDLISHTAQLRTRSIKKYSIGNGSKLISSKIEQTPSETSGPDINKKQISFDEKMASIRTDLSNDRKKSSSFKAKFQKSRFIQKEIQKIRSKQFVERSEYQKIFVECVAEVRKNIMRKDFTESLNYFKQNGPLSLVQFKKIDYLTLLELFLRKEVVANKFYQLLFKDKC